MKNLIIFVLANFMLCVAFNSNATPSDKNVDVLVEFNSMTNSAPDFVMNEEIFTGLVENALRDKGMKPRFISKNSGVKNGYLDLVVSYLYVPNVGVRALNLDVNGFNRKGTLICSDNSNTWWEGNQGVQAIPQETAKIVSTFNDGCFKM
jgi:hypothetical protein